MAQLANTQENANRASIKDDFSIFTCINSDEFPLPKSIAKTTQNNLPTTASIKRVVDNISGPMKRPTHSSLIPTDISLSDIQSVWSMRLEHQDAWRQLSLLKSGETLKNTESEDEKDKLQVYYYITQTLMEG